MKELSQIAASLADLYARWLPYRARGAFPLGCSSGFLVCPRKRCNHLVIKYNNMRCWPNISVKMVGPQAWSLLLSLLMILVPSPDSKFAIYSALQHRSFQHRFWTSSFVDRIQTTDDKTTFFNEPNVKR